MRIVSVLCAVFRCLGKCLPTSPILRDYNYAVYSQILYNFFSDFFYFFCEGNLACFYFYLITLRLELLKLHYYEVIRSKRQLSLYLQVDVP